MPEWTKAQQQVIDTRGKDMLVSAAAGSGKTAVLVERIIQKIMDREHPVDIDRMIVVTFTKAAAAQMRERILAAIEQALEVDPDNGHLIRQATLVHNAQITTIDSFCNYIVRNHFHEIGIDPDFRIGDEGEMNLMRQQVMDEMMERQYQQAQETMQRGETSSFSAFVDAYAKGTSDVAVTDMILRVFDKAQSYPWPKEWLQQTVAVYDVQTEQELQDSDWLRWIMDLVRLEVEEAKEQTGKLLELCMQPEGPVFYAEGLQHDLEAYEDLLAFTDTTRFYQAFYDFHYGTIGRKPRNAEVEEGILSAVKDGRDALKKKIEKYQKDYAPCPLSEVLEQMQRIKPAVTELIRLCECFMDDFAAYKRRKNVADFNDIEHFALNILKDETTHECTPTAEVFQQHYDEVMIDEYQDSNYIQEEILSSVSKDAAGGHNMFMVGDVKQSIYSFRQACPEIFTDKFRRFTEQTEGCIAIGLHQNFRSRKEVLDFTNDVFYPLMHEDLGNVEYNDEAALYLGAQSYPAAEAGMFDAQILVADPEEAMPELAGREDRIAYEAKVIADRINEMRKTQLVTDSKTGELRPMRMSDVVILLRSPGKMAERMVEVLMENGIPAFAEKHTGYFDTTEVEAVLNLLRIIDNPYQDIPLAAVLHSAMFGFSNDELAAIRVCDRKAALIENLRLYEQAHPEHQKTTDFLAFLTDMRARVADTPIHELIRQVLEETDYLTYVSAMPRGESRRANLDKLIDEAAAYESTSYKGLFHFINYIGQLQKYEVDMGEAELFSENDEAVAIMSIHKSKGLEFPVVFVSGLGRQFNEMDSRGQMVLHADLGIGLDLINQEERTRTVPLYKKVVAKAVSCDMYGEEMRILYVALTRAKEKLVLTGVLSDAAQTMLSWEENRGRLTFGQRAGAKQYLEWIVRATAAKRDRYPVQQVTPQQVILEEMAQQISRQQKREALQEIASGASTAWQERLTQEMAYRYPFAKEQRFKNKYSVSEIKHRQMELAFADEQSEVPSFLQEECEPIIPAFIQQKETDGVNRGALRGTAVHRFLECFDFTKDLSRNGILAQMEQMVALGQMTSAEQQLLSVDKLIRFLESPLALRMKAAAERGELYREKPFVMSVLPKDLFEDAKTEDETVLVQGIIDVFFCEEDGIVLLDYKTDTVREASELIRRYQAQLQLYAKAIGRGMKLPVKERVIYSFCLEETILL